MKPLMRIALTFLLALVLPQGLLAQGYQPPGYGFPGGMYPQQPYGPGQGGQQSGPWFPYQRPQMQQPRQSQTFEAPRVETSVSETAPYEQQSLVYTLRVSSSGNLKTLTPELEQVPSVVLRQLGEADTRAEQRGGSRVIVTEFRYLLMPLTAGRIEIPAARVSGTHADRNGREGSAFDTTARGPTILDVRPAADRAVQPWLPLLDLRIHARLLEADRPTAGRPFRLEVETRAVGATGFQLPSLASQLQSEEFRVYPGETEVEGSVAAKGDYLVGRRLETFTLVPQHGGRLQIPTLRINWWNVRYQQPEVAALPSHGLKVSGPSHPGASDGGDASDGPSLWFWLPLFGALGLALYGWLGAAFGSGAVPGAAFVTRLVKPIFGELYAPIAAAASRISPRRRFHRLRTWIGHSLPVSWKLWFCLRAVEREEDPGEWAQALQILAAKHLGVRPNAHLRQLGRGIVACHPRANAQEVDRLMTELDRAVYGGAPMASFAQWKEAFKRQIQPSLLPAGSRAHAGGLFSSRGLPQLNPR
jgi:hypothetical protein